MTLGYKIDAARQAGLVWAGRGGGQRDNRCSTYRRAALPRHPAPEPVASMPKHLLLMGGF